MRGRDRFPFHENFPLVKGSCERIRSRDALPRVRGRKTKSDAEHRVPTRLGRCDRGDSFPASGGTVFQRPESCPLYSLVLPSYFRRGHGGGEFSAATTTLLNQEGRPVRVGTGTTPSPASKGESKKFTSGMVSLIISWGIFMNCRHSSARPHRFIG